MTNPAGEYVSRRRFFQHVALGYVAANANFLANSAMGEERSGPVDCGPPPPPKRQSRSGGESFPPLPLPATPLRRTEKKRPPAPPALIGKTAMGPVKFITQEGKQVQYRDWMTDPADMTSLLSWTNEKLGIQYRSMEVDFTHFSYDPRELPALLFSGHNEFTLDPEVRAKLARYVLDGGTILADACCGWKDFDAAFRREFQAIFSQRPLRKLTPDDPVYSSYYKLDSLQYQKEDGSRYGDQPCVEGISVGCRLGVIYSPVDLTCGWDGHDHPRGLRVVVDQARQVGANYVTYLLANYQLGRFLSSTKVYYEAGEPSRDDFVMAQLVHEGDWDPDPSAIHNLLRFAKESSTLEVKFKRMDVRVKDPQAASYPLWYMTGHHEFAWSEEEATLIRRYLTAGGMLVADACCGRKTFDKAFRREIAKVLPDNKLEELPADHPLYSAHHEIKQVDYTPRTREDFGANNRPTLEGISLDGRLAVVYSRFDLGDGWEQFTHPYSYGYQQDDALKIGTNLLVYAVTH